ncbi:hypothetical protein BCR32DRAFT_325901 [Anaeromyces robustus]|uniref:Uncharacterized protein n=1 Tax=Anaeromyces robustus TaxID=1754192 RepID=A0A1Y1XFJ5_9FUNG|nr:hypothetical protein BCR32DRAFT_325901 [Anaeromyces robustus]|eukprot:ORX84487.1 hypothetical protein BCR32DRAFT_325901 [Anaeromyces robustus]
MTDYLRNFSYNVLVLGFYMWEGFSKEYVFIPINYVEKSIQWLKTAKPLISKILIAGTRYSLLTISLIPGIGCIILILPFNYVIEEATKKF